MHTIQKLKRPRRPGPHYMGFYAVYSDGQQIHGAGLGPDPIAAYHTAVCAALNNHLAAQPDQRHALQ